MLGRPRVLVLRVMIGYDMIVWEVVHVCYGDFGCMMAFLNRI